MPSITSSTAKLLFLSCAAAAALISVSLISPVTASGFGFVHKDLLAHPQYHVQYLVDELIPISDIGHERLQKGNLHRQQSPESIVPQIDTTQVQDQLQDQTQSHVQDQPQDQILDLPQEQHLDLDLPPDYNMDQSQSTDSATDQPAPPKNIPIDLSSSLFMTDAAGQKWLCSIPKTHVQIEIPEPEKTKEEIEIETRESVARGLSLLDHLSNTCLLVKHEYWTYEYCHKDRIRQFHGHNVNGKWEPSSKEATHVLANYGPSKSEILSNIDKKSSSVSEIEPATELIVTNDRKYLVQQWGNGDICDLTGAPRKVEVQFQCANVGDRIQIITEPSICTYIMVIFSASLCEDVTFELIPGPEANKIDCRPIVSDEQYQQRKVVSQGAIDDGLETQSSNQQIKFNLQSSRVDEESSIRKGAEAFKEMAALIDKVQASTRRKQIEDFMANIDDHINTLKPYLSKEQLEIIKKMKNQLDGKVHIIDEDTGPFDLDTLLQNILGGKIPSTKGLKVEKDKKDEKASSQNRQQLEAKDKKKVQPKKQELLELLLRSFEDGDDDIESDLKDQISLESILQKLDATKKAIKEQRKNEEEGSEKKKNQQKAADREYEL